MNMDLYQHSDYYIDLLNDTVKKINTLEIDKLIQKIQNSQSIFLLGKGRTGLVIAMFAMRLTHLGFQVHLIGQPTTPRMNSGDLFILASGSGETEGVILSAKQAKKINGDLFGLTMSPNSTLCSLCQNNLYIPCDFFKKNTPKNKVQTGTIFEQTLFLTLDCIVAILAERTNQDFSKMSERHANIE